MALELEVLPRDILNSRAPGCPRGDTRLYVTHGGWRVWISPWDRKNKKWLIVEIEHTGTGGHLKARLRRPPFYVRRIAYREMMQELAHRMLLEAFDDDWKFVVTKRQRRSFRPPEERRKK